MEHYNNTTIFVEDYKSRIPSGGSFLSPPVAYPEVYTILQSAPCLTNPSI